MNTFFKLGLSLFPKIALLLISAVFFVAMAQLEGSESNFEFSQKIEGFAGKYLDEQGILTILIVPSKNASPQGDFESQALEPTESQIEAIDPLLEKYYGAFFGSTASNKLSAQSSDKVKFMTAKYTFTQLFDWESTAVSVAIEDPNVVMIALRENINKIVSNSPYAE